MDGPFGAAGRSWCCVKILHADDEDSVQAQALPWWYGLIPMAADAARANIAGTWMPSGRVCRSN